MMGSHPRSLGHLLHSYGSHGSFIDDLPMLQMPIFHSNLGNLLYKLYTEGTFKQCLRHGFRSGLGKVTQEWGVEQRPGRYAGH